MQSSVLQCQLSFVMCLSTPNIEPVPVTSIKFILASKQMHIKIKDDTSQVFMPAWVQNQTNFEIFISYRHLITYRCSVFTLKPLIHEICKYFGVFFTSLTDKENQWRLETTISNRCFPRYMISNVSCHFVHELKTSHFTSAPWIFCRLYLSIVYLSNLIK